jgi:hypothetical protein
LSGYLFACYSRRLGVDLREPFGVFEMAPEFNHHLKNHYRYLQSAERKHHQSRN